MKLFPGFLARRFFSGLSVLRALLLKYRPALSSIYRFRGAKVILPF